MVNDLNRLSDTFAKFLFAREERKHLTLSLVNSVFEYAGETQLVDFDFLDRELTPENEFSKLSRLDILGKCSDGTAVNVEIQVGRIDKMQNRSLFYWSKMYAQLKSGEDYNKLKRTVCINILDHNYFDDEQSQDFHNCFKAINVKNHNHLMTDVFEIHFIEMPKFERVDKYLKNSAGKLWKWLKYLSRKSTEDERRGIAVQDRDIAEAVSTENLFFTNPKLWWQYLGEEKDRRDAIALKNTFLREQKEAIEKMRAEGLIEGRAEGIEEGKIEMIKNLISMKMSIEDISKASGWNKEKILELM